MSNLVVVTKYKVTRDNKNIKDPSTIRKGLIIPKSMYEMELRTMQDDPTYLLRYDLDVEATERLNNPSPKVKLPTIDELKSDPTKKATVEKTWNQLAKEIKDAQSMNEAREIFAAHPQFAKSKGVLKALEETIEKLANHED